MPVHRFTKHHGLKKLKKIAANVSGCTVSRYVVLSRPEQFRREQIGKASRLLVRIDEQGKRYRRFASLTMPRKDISTNLSDNAIKRKLSKMNKGDERKRFILHPTGKRQDIVWSGSISIKRDEMTVSIFHPSPKDLVHRNFLKLGEHKTKINIAFKREDNKFVINESAQALHGNGSVLSIAKNCLAFVNEGLKSRQLKTGGEETEICFVTWKHNPTAPEFYDLIEQRNITRQIK